MIFVWQVRHNSLPAFGRSFGASLAWGEWHEVQPDSLLIGGCTTAGGFILSSICGWHWKQRLLPSAAKNFLNEEPCGLWQEVQPLSIAGWTCAFLTSFCISRWHAKHMSAPAFRVWASLSDSCGLWHVRQSPAAAGPCMYLNPVLSEWHVAQSSL